MRRALLLVGAPAVTGLVVGLLALTGVFATGLSGAVPPSPYQVPTVAGNPSAGAAHDVSCAKGSKPERALQGEVTAKDRNDGASKKGYWCNLSLVGRYQGTGASWVSQSYKQCAYMSAAFPGDIQGSQPGVRVVDVSNPAHPKLSEVLTSAAMQSGT